MFLKSITQNASYIRIYESTFTCTFFLTEYGSDHLQRDWTKGDLIHHHASRLYVPQTLLITVHHILQPIWSFGTYPDDVTLGGSFSLTSPYSHASVTTRNQESAFMCKENSSPVSSNVGVPEQTPNDLCSVLRWVLYVGRVSCSSNHIHATDCELFDHYNTDICSLLESFWRVLAVSWRLQHAMFQR